MKILYFDCFSGISGDMTLGALMHLGVDLDYLVGQLQKLGVSGWEIKLEKAVKNGISANYARVLTTEKGSSSYDALTKSSYEEHTCHCSGESSDHHHHSSEEKEHHHHHHSSEQKGHHHHHHSSEEKEHHHHHHSSEEKEHHHHHHSSEEKEHHHHHHSSEEKEHHHHHHYGHNRNFAEIRKMIEDSALNQNVKQLAIHIFQRVANAEAAVHNSTPEQVHFHEVGALDSIVDIVGTAICIDYLKPDKIYSSVIQDGYGFIHCQHGKMPVPAPATVKILAERNVPLRQLDIPHELVTPTGAAIVAELAESFGLMPQMSVQEVGYGAGSRDLEIPNILRVTMGEAAVQSQMITVMETNIDDGSPEVLGYVMEKLLDCGAKDVYFSSIQMKKNRPAVKITILCDEDQVETLEDVLFRETATIGVRRYQAARTCLKREQVTVSTELGPVNVKKTYYKDLVKYSLEYEDAKRLAQQHLRPVREIYEMIAGFNQKREGNFEGLEKI